MGRNTFMLIVCSFLWTPILGQEFKKMVLSKQDRKKGLLAIYSVDAFENYRVLKLYNDKKFDYEYHSTNYYIFSKGKWNEQKDIITLNSGIDSNDVPIILRYSDTDTFKTYFVRDNINSDLSSPFYRTNVEVPINLKNEPIPDARVFINTDTTYCFPFFDTCIGPFSLFSRIKIDFGRGFRSRWVPIAKKDFKRLLCVAQVDFSFTDYISFRNFKLKVFGNKLKFMTKL